MEGDERGYAQGCGDEADEIADDTAAECDEDRVAGAFLGEKKVFYGGLSLA